MQYSLLILYMCVFFLSCLTDDDDLTWCTRNIIRRMASTLMLVFLFIPRFTAVSQIRAVSRSDGGPAPRHDHNAFLKGQPHQPCEGLIDTTAIGTDPQQTRLHTGVTPIFNQMELDKYSQCSDPIWLLTSNAAWIIIIHCSFIGQRRTVFARCLSLSILGARFCAQKLPTPLANNKLSSDFCFLRLHV